MLLPREPPLGAVVPSGAPAPLGVKLWPTLVFLKDGRAMKQVARPKTSEVREGFASIAE